MVNIRNIQLDNHLLLQRMTDMYSATAWAKNSPDGTFEKIEIERNVAGDDDVTFDVKFCGICHTDVHISNNDMVINDNDPSD